MTASAPLDDPGSRRFVRAVLAAITYERWPGETIEDPSPAVLPTKPARVRRPATEERHEPRR